MNKKQLASLGLGLAVAGGAIAIGSQPASAQSALKTEIDKVTAVSTMLTDLVTAFTTVLVTRESAPPSKFLKRWSYSTYSPQT